MTLEQYLESPVAEPSNHAVEVDGLRVTCYSVGCNYEEYFPTNEDAEVGKEVHASKPLL